MRTGSLLVLLAGLLAGCVSLSPAGQRVRYVERDSARFATCERLPKIYEAVDPSLDGAVIKIRNEVAVAGGTHVNVLSSRGDQIGEVYITQVQAEGYRCPTDVGGLQ